MLNSSDTNDYLFWISVTHFVPQVGFYTSLVLGLILLILNYFGAQKIFGSYKYIISIFTTFGMVFATVEIVVYPNVHNYKAAFLFFSFEESFGLSGSRTKTIPIAAYTFFHSATMALLSVQFIYRYWAVFDIGKLRFFKGAYSLIWVFYCAFFGFQYALSTYFFFTLDEVSTEYFREEVLLRYHKNISEFPATAMVGYDPTDGSVRWWNVMGIVNLCTVVNTQYAVMIYCGWSMHMQMEEKIKNFSETLRRHHKQFFKTLILQITTPTIILFIPITFMIFLPLFNLDVSVPSGVLLCSFTLYPAMDSITVMYVVSEYKKTAVRMWKTIRKVWMELNRKKNEPTTTPAPSAPVETEL